MRLSNFQSACLALMAAVTLQSPQARAQERELLMPDVDKTRKERLKKRFLTPEGFTVEEVANNDLVGSIINMTFDHLGRPALSWEHGGIRILTDKNGDGKYDGFIDFTEQFEDIQSAQGMYFVGPGDLLLQCRGPAETGAGLYRLTDTDGDDRADRMRQLIPSRGDIGEHGPHAIVPSFDGSLYVLYGNHAHPDVTFDPASPLRGMQEDYLLPRYVDPNGHANSIRAPGGTILRLDLATNHLLQFCGGFRNPFDIAIDLEGEIFAYDSDMEWDFGLPWFRPTRMVHAIPGGDYGWRTGSAKIPFYCIDTLPSIDDIKRGSPVGTAFYYHHVYPKKFVGALFMGDWSRGRIRVIMPKPRRATYGGAIVDFVLGEPLNVTDLDIGPDGLLYFTTGGRSTSGGLYRVRWEGATQGESATNPVLAVVDQPMPRSAWGREAIRSAREKLGSRWESELKALAEDAEQTTPRRLRAIEALQTQGPAPDVAWLTGIKRDPNPRIRAAAILLLGTHPIGEVFGPLVNALPDENPFVARRACEALVRAGLGPETPYSDDRLPRGLFGLLDHEDRFLRYAARLALMRVDRRGWKAAVSQDRIGPRPRGALESLLALIYTQTYVADSDAIFDKLIEYSLAPMDDETLLRYLRVLQLAFIRDLAPREPGRQGVFDQIGPRLLEKFPNADDRIQHELQVVLAYMQTPGAIPALLGQLTEDKTQEEQIHTVYCLRVIKRGWTREQRRRLVAWFDRGRKMGGAASMAGYIEDLWQDTLKILSGEERKIAEARKEKALEEEAQRRAALMADAENGAPRGRSNLAQMSFEEMSEYLEYDIMTYEKGDAEAGRKVFIRSKCINCHQFGTLGQGVGPDLSTVVKRFRRGEILESIMYPSKVISDQYTSLNVFLKDNQVVSGMLAGEDDTTLTLINTTGDRIDIKKSDIEERRPSTVSIMPEGLLETMNLGDLVNLILFLEKGDEG